MNDAFSPVTVLSAHPVVSPLVLDSPHSGRVYPADFSYACPQALLRRTEDSYVDELIAGAADHGIAVVLAEFPRCYIDANRAVDDIDPLVLVDAERVKLSPTPFTLRGLGLVRRLCGNGVPVYHRRLSWDDIHHRIEKCYYPYYQAIDALLTERHEKFGRAVLINCHSMPDRAADGNGASRADFVLGDRHASSCNIDFRDYVQAVLQDKGYSVAINDPYAGVEIVRRFGLREQGRQALQLEINRRLYMNEQTLERLPVFAKLRADLAALFAQISGFCLNGK